MRKYKRKSNRGQTATDAMERAVRTVITEGKSVTSVAKDFLIAQKTLHRYVVKARSQEASKANIHVERVCYFNGRQVFSKEQEVVLRLFEKSF